MQKRKILFFTVLFLLMVQIVSAAPRLEFKPSSIYYQEYNSIIIEGNWVNNGDRYEEWTYNTEFTVNVLTDDGWRVLAHVVFGPSNIKLAPGDSRFWRYKITGVEHLNVIRWNIHGRVKY